MLGRMVQVYIPIVGLKVSFFFLLLLHFFFICQAGPIKTDRLGQGRQHNSPITGLFWHLLGKSRPRWYNQTSPILAGKPSGALGTYECTQGCPRPRGDIPYPSPCTLGKGNPRESPQVWGPIPMPQGKTVKG